MKPFSFSLSRVKDIRRAQANQERVKLDQIERNLNQLAAAREALVRSAEAQAKALAVAGEHSPEQLHAVDRFSTFARQEYLRTAGELAALERQVQEQRWWVQQAEQRCVLLEKLEARQREHWMYLAGREIEEQASDAFLAKLHRERNSR
jgi:flagellar biosynthesis chaperone FliJ